MAKYTHGTKAYTGWLRRNELPGKWRPICSGDSPGECWSKLDRIRKDVDSGMKESQTEVCVRPTVEGRPDGKPMDDGEEEKPIWGVGDIPCPKCNGFGCRKSGKKCQKCNGIGFVFWGDQ